MFHTGNGLSFGSPYPYAQAKGVGQTHQGDKFAQFLVAAQVTVFQVKTPSFQVLETLFDGPALRVELPQRSQAGRAKEKEKFPVGQRFDPGLPPHTIDLYPGEAPDLPHGQAQVGNGVALAAFSGQQMVLGQAHHKIKAVVLEPF